MPRESRSRAALVFMEGIVACSTTGYLPNVETPRAGGNPRWGRLRSGDNGSNRKGSSRRHLGKSRGPAPADSLRGVRCYRRLGDAPTGGSPRHGASLQWAAGDCRGSYLPFFSAAGASTLASMLISTFTSSPSSTPPLSTALFQTMPRSEEHTSELQSRSDLVCRLLLEKQTKLRSTAPLLNRRDGTPRPPVIPPP